LTFKTKDGIIENMGRKKKDESVESNYVSPVAHWVVNEEWTINGRNLVRGTEVTIRGERGRFRFVKHVYNPKTNTEWVDVVGGVSGYEMGRSFRPDRVKVVHNKKKTRKSKEDETDVE